MHGFGRIVLILAAIAAQPSAAAALSWSVAKESQAKDLIARFLRPGPGQFPSRPPALSIAVGIDGKLAMADGFGEAATGSPATARTVYRIGSLTKQFTAAAILKLIEDGARAPASGAPLTLDMQVTDILGEAARWTQPDQNPITIRSLLTMTSNLPNFTRRPPANLDPWGAIAAPKLLDEVRQLAPSGWPSSFEYSNTNYFLLSAIIDAAQPRDAGSPRGYDGVLRQLIFAAAGMTATGFYSDGSAGAAMAQPNYRRKPAFSEPDWLRGSGDMVSTALDLFAWNSGLLAGRVIAANSVEQMLAESARVTPTDYYGMGWFIAPFGDWTLYSHTGSVPGFTCFNAISRDASRQHWASVTLLTNMDGVMELDGLADELLRLARQD
ncbi:MAG: serine hydrolase domain-containing protein [Hyphomicrobium sp.]